MPIVEQLKQYGGYTTQKELLSELQIDEKTLITNIKKLEDAGIVFTERSSTKFIYRNPAIFHFNDLVKLVREQFLLLEG
jgi:DNA-binding MarR family transcriptional regulator